MDKTSATLDFRRVAKPAARPTEKSLLFVGPGVATTEVAKKDRAGAWSALPAPWTAGSRDESDKIEIDVDFESQPAVASGELEGSRAHWSSPVRTLPAVRVRAAADSVAGLPALPLERPHAGFSVARLARFGFVAAAVFAAVAMGNAARRNVSLTKTIGSSFAYIASVTDSDAPNVSVAVPNAVPAFAGAATVAPPVVKAPPLKFEPITIPKPAAAHPAVVKDPDLVAPLTVPMAQAIYGTRSARSKRPEMAQR